MTIYGRKTKYDLVYCDYIWSSLALGCATHLTVGPFCLCAYAATRLVGPSPPRSRESWCPGVRTVPPRMPLNQLPWSPLAPGFVDTCIAGEPVWVGNAGSVNGSARVRVTTDSQRSPRAGGSVVLERSAGSPLLYASW